MVVDLFHVGSFRNGTTIKFSFLLEYHFKVSIDIEGNLEVVLPTMESQEKFSSGMSILTASLSMQYS